MNPLKLMFVRHAQSVGNVEKRMQGCADFPLTDAGRVQAAKLAHRLLAEAWHPTHIYSSPIKRTVQTTEILLTHLLAGQAKQMAERAEQMAERLPASVRDETGLSGWDVLEADRAVQAFETLTLETLGDRPSIPVTYADELVEHKNGVFEGLTWAEAQHQHPQLCIDLESSLDWIPVPGSETLSEARSRTQQFIHRLMSNHQNGDHVLIVSHSWILQHLMSAVLGCDRVWRISSTNTGLFEFWIERSRWDQADENSRFNTDLWQIRRFNDAQHLQ